MKLTRKLKQIRNNYFMTARTINKTKPIKDIINFISDNMIFLHKTNTVLDLVTQIDKVTNGQEYEVNWYILDSDYLQINIKFINLDFFFYCKEILNTLENFLHVDCELVEKLETNQTTTKSIICLKGE